MNTQPEALRLADALDDPRTVVFFDQRSKAAAELRRLTAVEAERDALKQTLHDELAGNLRLRYLGGARPDEPMLTFLERIIAERDALLGLLKEARKIAPASSSRNLAKDWDQRTTAAIKAVEKGK